MNEKQQEELRRRVSEIQNRKPTRRRYPEDLRQAVSSYARERTMPRWSTQRYLRGVVSLAGEIPTDRRAGKASA